MKLSNIKRRGAIGERKPRRSSTHTSEPGTLPSPAYPVAVLWQTISLAVAMIVAIIGLSVLLHIYVFMRGMPTDNASGVTDTWAGITQSIASD